MHPTGSGDGNASGAADGLDIQQFVDILTDGGVSGAAYCAYDMNGDGVVDLTDIPGFLTLVTSS